MYIKKLLLLLFLIPVLASAQKTTGPNYTYIAQRYEWLAGVFKALGLPAGDSAQFQAGQEMRAGAVYYDSTGANAGLYVYDGAAWQSVSEGVPYLNSTGLLANGLLTINGGDNSKFDLAAGTGEVVDYATDPVNPSKINVSFGPFTAQTVTDIATADKTYVMVNSAGAITQQTTFPTQQERRQKIFVGAIVHPNHSTIQNARTVPDFVQGPASQLYDFFDALGAFSVDGNRISANGANLSFNKTAGHIFRRGANYQGDDQNPHVATLAAGTPQSFIKASVNAQVGGTVTVVDPANYDVAGTITPIPGGVNTSTIQRVYAFSSGLVFVQYGQTLFSSLSAAIAGIANEAFTINPSIADGGVLLAYIVLTKSCTNLSDAATAAILPAPRFDAGVGGGSSAVTSLQQAYNNSVTPQITTSTTLGSFDIKRGSAADADNVFRVMNGAGTAVTSIDGTGLIFPVTNNSIDFGKTTLAWKDIYSYTHKLKGATSGEGTLQAAAIAGTNTWTLPAVTGTVVLREGAETITGTKTFSALLTANSGINTQAAAIGSNFSSPSGSSISNTSTATFQIGGAATTHYRVSFAGSTNTTLLANASYASVLIASTSSTEAASGNTPINTGLAVKAQTITDGAGGTDYLVGGYFEGPPTGISPNIASYGLWVDNGLNRFDGMFAAGATSLTANQIWGANSGATSMEGKTLTNGQNIKITHGAGTATFAGATLKTNLMLELPTASENIFWFYTPVAITVSDVRAVLVGSSTPSVTYQVSFDSDRSAAGTNVYTAGQTVTSTTTMTAASGVNDNTIPAGSIVKITTSAQSGTVGQLNVTLTYTED